MAEHPSDADIRAMLAGARKQEQSVGLQVAAPMNDVQLMCMMAAYLRATPLYHTASYESVAEEAFELAAYVTSIAADQQHIGLRDRVMEIINQRNAGKEKVANEGATGVGSQQPDGKPKLIVVKD